MSLNIIGIIEQAFERGTIGTSGATGATIFLPGTSNIWTRPYLQMISSGGGFVSLSISHVITSKGLLPGGPFIPGIFANQVKQFDVRFDTDNCVARAVVTTVLFG